MSRFLGNNTKKGNPHQLLGVWGAERGGVPTGPLLATEGFIVMLLPDLTIDTEIKAKRNNMISELIALRITKAKAKAKFGAKYLCGHDCERSSVQLISIRKRKQKHIFGELISLNFRVNGTVLRQLGLGILG